VASTHYVTINTRTASLPEVTVTCGSQNVFHVYVAYAVNSYSAGVRFNAGRRCDTHS
jgi:hypothetical protein